MAYFFQTRLKQKMIAARYTNHPLVSIPSQNCYLIWASQPPKSRPSQDGYPNSAGMAYFFQTRLKLKTIAARLINLQLWLKEVFL